MQLKARHRLALDYHRCDNLGGKLIASWSVTYFTGANPRSPKDGYHSCDNPAHSRRALAELTREAHEELIAAWLRLPPAVKDAW